MEAVRAAAQHHGVAALQAQRAGVGGDVGAALVDDADDAERHRDALDDEPVGPLHVASTRPTGSGSAATSSSASAIASIRVVERQPVEERRGEALGARRRDVARVGGEDFAGALAQELAPRASSARFLLSAGALASARAAARASAPMARMAARTSAAGGTVSEIDGLGHRRSALKWAPQIACSGGDLNPKTRRARSDGPALTAAAASAT